MLKTIQRHTTQFAAVAVAVCGLAFAPTADAQIPDGAEELIEDLFNGRDEGGGWWRAEFLGQTGYFNVALYPYVYILEPDTWLYVLGDTDNAYVYAFDFATWIYTNAVAAPWIYIFEGPNSGLLQSLLGFRAGWVDPAVIAGFLGP